MNIMPPGHDAPCHHDAGNPNTGADSVQDDVAGHFKKEVADEEHARTQAVYRIRKTQITSHLQFCKTHIDAVKVSNDVTQQQEGDQSPSDLEIGGFFKG
jgi:hypothetical protein